MNLTDAVGEMRVLSQPTEPQIMSLLGAGYHIILADMTKRGDILLKYDMHVRDNVFYVCKMSDSTREKIVLTPESASPFDGAYPHIAYEGYISQKDLIYVDEAGLMHEAEMRMEQFSHEAIKGQLEEQGDGTMAFNDIYSPFEGVDVPEVNIYLIDTGIPGTMNILRDAVGDVRGAHLAADPKQADFSILPMPLQAVTGQGKFFTGQRFEPSAMKQAKAQLAPLLGKALRKADGILPYTLLFWTGDAVAYVGNHSNDEARLKAATELADAITEYLKDKAK